MSTAHKNPVLIAGAGPVGLTAALALAQRGVPSLVLEKREGLSPASKASTFHAPTLEIMQEFGVLDAMLAQGQKVERIQFRHVHAGTFAEFRHKTLAPLTSCPFRVHLEQSALTPLLLERLLATGLSDVRFNTEVIDAGSNMGTDNPHAWFKIRNQDGSHQTLQADYALGADGAHSPVRKALGISFDGTAYPGRVLRVIVTNNLEDFLPDLGPVVYLYLTADRSISLLKMADCWRIIIRVPAGTDDATALSPDWHMPIIAEFLPNLVDVIAVQDRDIYGASKMVAEHFHQDRVFLIGDSTHLTNTRGGMNMNCGIHDAYALANAIASARRQGDPGAVVTAALQRQKVAIEQLIPRTDKNVSGKVDWLETVAAMAASPERALEYLAGTAMLDMAPPRTLRSPA